MHMDPLVSERLYIDWLPAAGPPAHIQDERVIVVQGRTGFYLDLRYRTARHDEADTVTWATAGWKTFQPVSEGQDPRARFTAIFDSHRLRPETSDKQELASSGTDHDPPDEGSFSTLPNGDVLERGEMRRPETGDITPYEERWRRLPLTRDEDAPVPAVMLESTDAGDKAFLGRVGDFEVAIAQRGEQIQARVGRLHGTTWETSMATVDGAGLPDLSVLDLTAMDGGGVELAGRRWKVIEQSS